MKTIFLLIAPLLIFSSCKKDNSVEADDSTETINIDCSGSCTEFIVPGDPYQSNPDFYGYADPSIRKDRATNVTWLAYSFPHYKMSGSQPVPSVEIHLAKSTDDGVNWSFVKKLFEPVAINNPADTIQPGFLDHETINLLHVNRSSENFWLGVRLNYFIPTVGGFSARPNNSFHISIIKSDRPENLTSGEVGTIGGSLTHSNWNVQQKLIPPDLSGEYFFWNEPALYFDASANKLYLIMVAFVYYGSAPVMAKNNTYVYATTPNGAPNSWVWDYKGKLADASIANELSGERISQTDIAEGKDGKLLLIASPDDWNSSKNDFNHKGCKVVEIKSLENPELERDNKGKLRVRVSITTSDANDLGSGASAYDANSVTGILFTKRVKTTSSLTANIWKTGVRP